METTIVGYPRIGKHRELKFAVEKYWNDEITKEELENVAQHIRMTQWNLQKEKGLSYIPCNTFSYYDMMLDTSFMLHAIPTVYEKLYLDDLDTYFAMARGYQGEYGDVKAFSMKKWFNTNYHYLVPELYDDTQLTLCPQKLLREYKEARQLGLETRPVVYGPFTFLKLSKTMGTKKKEDYVEELIQAYKDLLTLCKEENIVWLQIDEPSLVCDLSEDDIQLFDHIYQRVLENKGTCNVLLQTYFGDVRDSYTHIMNLPFDGIGLDFVEGRKTQELLKTYGFPEDKILFAGLVNGKNIWLSSYETIYDQLSFIDTISKRIILSTSCSLLHVPYTIASERRVSSDILEHFAYAEEKLNELSELKQIIEGEGVTSTLYKVHEAIVHKPRMMENKDVVKRVAALREEDFVRKGKRKDRQALQKRVHNLPLFPTTTIGSFPQTADVKRNRTRLRKEEISKEEYDRKIYAYIRDCVELQEHIGLDVLVHGEFERSDMVEYFGEQLSGFVFTDMAWVQSYGTRCVKPPVIYNDIHREEAMSVSYTAYAQSLSDKPVKGMLSGPVTILNWSFPREDITKEEIAYQIALAVRDEVQDLEAAGIRIIQIDEAALREKLPLRRQDWHSMYLDWAIRSFRLCHSGVSEETQIHTHMCYSEFEDIIVDIDAMDADVITFEASRSKLSILDSLQEHNFETEVGPGVYDIHSPRVPSVEEIIGAVDSMLKKIKIENIWINPDCGLKTRGEKETIASLENMVKAAVYLRKNRI